MEHRGEWRMPGDAAAVSYATRFCRAPRPVWRAVVVVSFAGIFLPCGIAARAQNASSEKKPVAKPLHVYTNDDLSSHGPRIDDPAAQKRFDELNECNTDCFNKILTEAVRTFQYPYPRNDREKRLMQEKLLATLDELRSDPEWQKLLRNAVVTKYAFCAEWRKESAAGASAPTDGQIVSRGDVAADEKREHKLSRSNGSYNAATSALMDYRWSSKPGPMKAAVMVHQFISLATEQCSRTGDEDP
jgi:hypothetical protein